MKKRKKQVEISAYFKRQPKNDQEEDERRSKRLTEGGVCKYDGFQSDPSRLQSKGQSGVQLSLGLRNEKTPKHSSSRRSRSRSRSQAFARDEFYCKMGVVNLQEDSNLVGKTQRVQQLTPLEKQVDLAKKEYPDLVLLFEVGYRYRFFGDDAETASKVLRIACYRDHYYMTASVPVQRVGIHVVRLVERGYKVGIVSQTETAAIKASTSTSTQSKQAPFQRSLSALYTRSVLSAATFPEADTSLVEINLSDVTSHHLMCLFESVPVQGRTRGDRDKAPWDSEEMNHEHGNGDSPSVAFTFVALNVSNGDLTYHCVGEGGGGRGRGRGKGKEKGSHSSPCLQSELQSFLLCMRPCEVLISSDCSQSTRKVVEEVALRNESICGLIRIEERSPGSGSGLDFGAVRTWKKGENEGDHGYDDISTLLESFGSRKEGRKEDILHSICNAQEDVVRCIRIIVDYLKELNLESVLQSCEVLHSFQEKNRMKLPAFSVKALELLQNGNDGRMEGSLISLIDRTKSSIGARLVRRWLLNPLQCIETIEERQDCVQDLIEHHDVREEVDRLLQLVPDVDKLIGRVHNASARPSDFMKCMDWLKDVRRSLGVLHGLKKENMSAILKRCLRWGESDLFLSGCDALRVLDVKAARADDKRKLFTCRTTFPDIFALVLKIRAGKQDLHDLLSDFASLLQVRTLKYTSIQNQGDYLIELPEHQAGVPESWTKICATKSVNRWQPVEVKEKLRQLSILNEYLDIECDKAWKCFLEQFRPRCNEIRSLADALAELDVLSGFASLCFLGDTFTRPQFVRGEGEGGMTSIEIEEGRHPLLDHRVCTEVVPNDTHLCSGALSTMVVSGPNAGGKTIFIKQVALLCLMAHLGCFVPAKAAKLTILDGLFVRMGAEDSLAQGLSTFQVELMEASQILRESTSKSLIVLDELGRGTSTHDGLSLAMATLLYLISKERNPLTLFVTHYQQILEELEKEEHSKRAQSFFVSYVEDKESHEVTYLYKMKKGRCPSSFGFNVARNAGIPPAVVQRAILLSHNMEQHKA